MKPEAPSQFHSRPSMIKNSLLALLSLIIIYTVFFNFIDIPCAQLMHTFSNQSVIYKISLHLQTIFSPAHWLILSCIFILIGFGLFFNQKKKSLPYFQVGLTGVFAFIIAGVCKVILARYRPIEFFNSGLYGFHFFSDQHAFNSTPSGHTVMAVATLGSIANLLKKTWAWVYIIPICVLIALSRLVLNAHFISDLIFGGYVGFLSVYWVNYFFKINKLKIR